MNDSRNEILHNPIAIAYLIAVDLALPGGTAMHQLIAQHIETVKENTDKDNRVLNCEELSFAAFNQLNARCTRR